MKVLLTGSRGYIGSVLEPMLLERGYEVVGLDTDLYRDCGFLAPPRTSGNFIEQDIRNIVDVEGFDAIIHLAGLSNDALGDLDPELTDAINHKASVRLATLAKNQGVKRFLYASSCSTYGEKGEDFVFEDESFNPVTPYGKSKGDSEVGISKLADETFCPVFLRGSTVYGSSHKIRFDLVVNNLSAWALTTGNVRMKSDGSPWRPLCHVRDMAEAYIQLLEAPPEDVSNQAFNIGATSENYQVRDIAEAVKNHLDDCELTFADDAAPDRRCYRVNCDKISRVVPSYRATRTIQDGIRELVQDFREDGLQLEDFEGIRYKRIAHLKHMISNGTLSKDLYFQPQNHPAKDCNEKEYGHV